MMVPKGSILNAALVLAGGLLGGLIGRFLTPDYQKIALSGLGLVTLVIGVKMALGSKNVLVVAASIALGGMLGLALGINAGLESLATLAQSWIGVKDDTNFVTIVVAATVLYCVGPMTLLGCIQERLERRIELLSLKSTLDGIAAIFFGATSWPAMVLTALLVLIFQSALTFAAQPLRALADDEELLAELTGTGGIMLMATGLGLLGIAKIPTASYLPALILAPGFIVVGRRFRKPKALPR